MTDLLSHHPAQSMRPFSSEPSATERRIKLDFSVQRSGRGLDFSFVLAGAGPADLSQLLLPDLRAVGERRRQDELWKSTCLEIFFGPADSHDYLELNLCPTGDWNLYCFDSYRAGMKPAADAVAPPLSHERSPGGDTRIWTAHLAMPEVGAGALAKVLSPERAMILGAAAVLAFEDGTREYWALAHAAEKPDFHRRESFKLVL